MTAATFELKLAELERRVSYLEQFLAPSPRSSEPQMTERTDMLHSTSHDREALAIGGDTASEMAQRAEELLDSLLSMTPPRLVSYSEAYRRIIGPYAVWRNAVHAPAVIQLARQTSSRRVGRLTIRLDALIVGKETRRPAGGHFATAAYSEADWIQTFGTWSLLS